MTQLNLIAEFHIRVWPEIVIHLCVQRKITKHVPHLPVIPCALEIGKIRVDVSYLICFSQDYRTTFSHIPIWKLIWYYENAFRHRPEKKANKLLCARIRGLLNSY